MIRKYIPEAKEGSGGGSGESWFGKGSPLHSSGESGVILLLLNRLNPWQPNPQVSSSSFIIILSFVQILPLYSLLTLPHHNLISYTLYSCRYESWFIIHSAYFHFVNVPLVLLICVSSSQNHTVNSTRTTNAFQNRTVKYFCVTSHIVLSFVFRQ
jgi:hypothetical protein